MYSDGLKGYLIVVQIWKKKYTTPMQLAYFLLKNFILVNLKPIFEMIFLC